jgi:hypothetical protein
MTYFLKVNPRLTSWLVAALLALAAARFVPASRIAIPCTSYEIVGAGKTQWTKCPVKRNEPRLLESGVFRRAQSLLPLIGEDFAGSIPGFYPTLFRRPPPALSLNCVSKT